MTLAGKFFARNPQISIEQRNAASQVWKRLLQPSVLPTPTTDGLEAIRNEVRTLLSQKDPFWRDELAEAINSEIFKNRNKPDLTLKSDNLPEGVLLEATQHCKIPLAAVPPHISMSFPPNNNIRINNVEYDAHQLLGLFAKPKTQESNTSPTLGNDPLLGFSF